MLKAGFTLDEAWHRVLKPKAQPKKSAKWNPPSVDKLIYWKRGDIRVVLFDYQQISLKRLVNYVVEQAHKNLMKKARIVYG